MNSAYPWLGIVIQGPIISNGRKPLAARKPHQSVTKEDLISYDSINNIKVLLAAARSLVGKYICVTWDTEDLSQLSEECRDGYIMAISDNLPKIPGKVDLLPSNNKLRQFYSTYKGIKQIQALDKSITHIIKIRTDQEIDLSMLCKEFSKIVDSAKTNKYIVTPGYVEGMISGLHDFYLGGEINEMLNLFQSFCERRFQFAFSVHTDLFAHAAFTWRASNPEKIPFYSYFLKDDLYSPQTALQQYVAFNMWKYHVKSWPISIWESLLWRGYPIGGIFSVHESALSLLPARACENFQSLLRNPLKLLWDSLEVTNWNGYHSVCKDTILCHRCILLMMHLKQCMHSTYAMINWQTRRFLRLLNHITNNLTSSY